MVLETNLRAGLFRGRLDLKKRFWLKAELAGDNIPGTCLNKHIEVPNRSIIIPPGHLEFVLNLDKALVQIDELAVGLQVRIGFGNRKDGFEPLGQLIFRAGTFLHLFKAGGLAAQTNNFLQNVLFMGGITFDDFDQVRNKIVPTLKLNIDAALRFL